MISLDLMIRLISSITSELTDTWTVVSTSFLEGQGLLLTLFPDQAVVAVVRVVGVACHCASAVSNHSKVEF